MADDIKGFIPNKEDTKLGIVFKVLGIAKYLFPEKKELSLIKCGFIPKKNKQFVSFFSGLGVEHQFEERKEYQYTITSLIKELYSKDVGTIAFIEKMNVITDDEGSSVKCSPAYEPVFFHSPDFDFEKIAEVAWSSANNHIEIAAHRDHWEYNFTYSKFIPIKSKQFGSSEERLKKFTETHNAFREKGVSRSYLFVGPPGTGKSTMAQKFASEYHNRIMRIDANSLYELHSSEFLEVLQFLKPDCLIVNEFDKEYYFSSNWKTGGSILQTLEDIKDQMPELTMLFTANSITPLPDALLRPGRIDDIIEFELPDKEDREAILRGYLNDMSHPYEEDQIKKLADETENLSGAYLKELSLRIDNKKSENIYDSIKRMLRVVNIKKEQAVE